MKTNNWLRELPIVLIIAIPWIIFFYLGESLPAQVPSHYSITSDGWVVDRYMSPVGFVTMSTVASAFIYLVMTLPAAMVPDKTSWLYYFKLVLIVFFTILCICTLTGVNMSSSTFHNLEMVIFGVTINGFVYWVFNKGKKAGKQPVSAKFYNIIWAGTHFITALPFVIGIFASQHWVSQRTIPQAVFLFIAVIANLTNSVKPNHFIGIRTPWTLANEEVWRKTHQVCSKWFFIFGLIGFILSIVAPISWLPRLLCIIPLSCTIAAMIYSYWLYKKRVSV